MTNPPDISSPVFAVPRQGANGSNSLPGATRAGGRFLRDGKRWTPEEHDELRRLWADPRYTRMAVSRALRRKLEGVMKKAKKLNLGEKK